MRWPLATAIWALYVVPAEAWQFKRINDQDTRRPAGVLTAPATAYGTLSAKCFRDGPALLFVILQRPGSEMASYLGERPARFVIDDEAIPNETRMEATVVSGRLAFVREVSLHSSAWNFPLAVMGLMREGKHKVSIEVPSASFSIPLTGARKPIGEWLNFCGVRVN